MTSAKVGNRIRGKGRDRLATRGFGRAVKRWRVVANLTQAQLAELSGMSEAVVGHLEREEGNVALESILKLCHGLETVLDGAMRVAIFDEAMEALWHDLTVDEPQLRQTVERPRIARRKARERDLEAIGLVVDEVAEGVKTLIGILYDGTRNGCAYVAEGPEGELKPGRVRVRRRNTESNRAANIKKRSVGST